MLRIFETDHWQVTHRKDSRYPGFLILSAKGKGKTLSALDTAALAELGPTLARAESLLIDYFKPYRVLVAKLGFSPGYNCHFHLLPVTKALLKEIKSHPLYSNEPDGNDALLYTSREYGERPLNQNEQAAQQHTVEALSAHLQQHTKNHA